ncbi:MAG TPA: fibronectin type III domain-containing protein [Terriglobia bacterium]
MKRVLLVLFLLGLSRAACHSQTATGTGSISGGGSLSMLATTHSASLTWTASTSSGVTGYNVYRSTTNGGPYTKLTSSPLGATATAYTDSSVTAGTTYYYMATALVGSSESGYSGQASATVPTP